MVNQCKIDRIQTQLKQNGIDYLILCLSHNILGFLGYWTGGHAAKALIPSAGRPAIFIPSSERCNVDEKVDKTLIDILTYEFESPFSTKSHLDYFLELLHDRIPENFDGTIGIEETFEDGSSANFFGEFKFPSLFTFNALRNARKKARFVDATGLIAELKFVKSPEEVADIRKAAYLAGLGYRAVRDHLKPGMTEAEVAAILESEVMVQGTGKNGVRYSRAFSSVYTGARGALQNAYWAATSGETVRAGDLVIIELGSVTDGYWCDLTRCICAGEPDALMQKRYGYVKRAQAEGLKMVKDGAKFSEVPEACYRYYESEGFGPEFYKHGVGHGTGYNYHEGPPLHVANSGIMREGMVLCIEPGLYFPGEYGMRLEDMIVVTHDGYEFISECNREL